MVTLKDLLKEDYEQFFHILKEYDLEKGLLEEDYIDLALLYSQCKNPIFLKKEDRNFDSADVSELLLFLLKGKDIQVSAVFPQEGMKTIQINKNMNQALQQMLKKYLIDECWESEEYVEDEELMQNAIEKRDREKKRIVSESKKKSRIPDYGMFVMTFLNSFLLPKALYNISKIKRYSLLADFLYYNKRLPDSYTLENWGSKDNKEKYDIVKTWVRSFEKKHKNQETNIFEGIGGIRIIRKVIY